MAHTQTTNDPSAIGERVTNDAEAFIDMTVPYIVSVTLLGTAGLLLHGWSTEAVEEKGAASKGSKAKKTDNVESYVYRNQAGEICIPGTYLIGSIINPSNGAAKYRQDPRSPRKSAVDLFKAAVIPLTELAPITASAHTAPAKEWDYLDTRRVRVQQAAISRTRPAFHTGWSATFELTVLTPEYISRQDLLDTLVMAGKLVGLGDFRPSYGRFQITRFEDVELS